MVYIEMLVPFVWVEDSKIFIGYGILDVSHGFTEVTFLKNLYLENTKTETQNLG